VAQPGASGEGTDDKPLLTWWQFAAFQFLNPKTWLATIAFVSASSGCTAPEACEQTS